MSYNYSNLKKKIIYRSNYRGTKEMDVLLSSFVSNVIEKLNDNELSELYNFLNIDDENLYKFKQGLSTEIKIEDNKISKLFKEYIYKK
tara:strand:+ start:30 stop:293 length:264 start_codon:yes stop_codon:yes gene_type:complete